MSGHDLVFEDLSFINSTEVSENIDPAARPKFLTANKTFGLSPSEVGKDINDRVTSKISYVMNNYVHRCDDFSQLDPLKYNVLFAGTSATFGEGLPKECVWDYIVYENLKKDILNIGPFHSLSFIGGDTIKVVYNIFKYINKFGLPSEIFLCVSNYAREVRYFESIGGFKTKRWDQVPISEMPDGNRQQLLYTTIASIRMLMTFCKTNNVKLTLFGYNFMTSTMLNLVIPELAILPESSVSPEKSQDDGRYDLSKYDRELLFWARDRTHAGIISNLDISDAVISMRK